ncbi:hypothetical protein M441DRAFT_54706 [Trichoderma asperellum CBS 433.97]|uniref:Peptidase S8/S53 domain-containing protein n=1 Tax=Trichoderma asperellum (strain ATCC 204424 / CBS 433.97 / NBRC 101777) TaxID=1042311 RepID=A0A2T3ZLK1_TRIA4|nr:hypothetical protein M441DRAFT_54706 [Trichoderma asperellum CBS 433.97]PTB45663.1 hypothetical protein M441DRAFT_54706 [Trichoderma asperellum CBS 433.97]
MSLSIDIRSSQTRTELASNTDSVKTTVDQKEPSNIQSVDHTIIKEWKKRRKDEGPSKIRLHDQAYDLFKYLRTALEAAARHEELPRVISEIKIFLKDEKKTHEIDDCIRWLVLDRAVQQCELGADDCGFSAVRTEAAKEDIGNEKNICIIIIRIIIEVSPHLSFINLYTPHTTSKQFPVSEWKPLTRNCHFDKVHSRSEKGNSKSTPLHIAAANGNGKAIKHMIHEGRHFQPDILLHILKLKNPDSTSEKTPLSLAATAQAGDLGGLHALLGFNTGIADKPDTTFTDALKKGRGNVVEVFLQQPERRKKFANTNNILSAIQPLENIDKITNQDTDEDANQDTRSTERRTKQVDVINTLIKAADPQSRTNEKVVEKIIQLDLEEVWSKNESIFKSDTSGLLHLAVQHQKIGFVKKFLQYDDESITTRSHNHYPLWHNNNIMENSMSIRRVLKDEASKVTQREIRDLIVAATIKSKRVNKMQDLLEIFQLSDVNELCFDLSRFNSKAYSVSDFVRSLIRHQDYANLLSYEETLKYAAFPALDLQVDKRERFGDNIQFEHSEIFDVLDWLKKEKKVTDIIELTVLDRLVNPHDEVSIGIYVKKFNVEVLNWRILDLSISVFKNSEPSENNALQQIRELHLYTSGKRAVISHWLSEDGICSLTNLTTLEIYVIQELATRDRCRAIVAFIESEFSRLSEEINEKREKLRLENTQNTSNSQDTQDADDIWKLTVGVSIRPWNPTEEREADLGEIAERAVPKLSRFIKGYRTYVRDITKEDQTHARDITKEDQTHAPDINKEGSAKFRPIRVAVIDNGILSISPSVEAPSVASKAINVSEYSSALNVSDSSYKKNTTSNGYRIEKDGEYKTLWSRIKKGRSFVDDESRVSSWLFASDPHGTQMANLICAIDPCCDLYVAKVAEGRSGIIPARVERAVRWAISQDVDIISMSFAILEGTIGLSNACADAINKGIIILCSTPDEGLNTEKSCISGYSDTITITACDEFGIVSPNAPSYFQYAIRGIDVAAGTVPFLESKDYISGSSVSTAIAAGLSSLILACDRLAKERKNYERGDRARIVKHHFGKMVASNKKYIMLERFAEIDKKIKDGRYINAKDIIEGFFLGEKYAE